MVNREQELIKLKEHIDNISKEATFLLQNLQWDHKHLLESPAMASCRYVADHRIPLHSVQAHEDQCYLRQEGYSTEDVLLPDLISQNTDTVVKLSKQDILKIINRAASMDPLFKRGAGTGAVEPLSAERLQHAYSADERRAIHEAVVAAAPACHDLADLALGSASGAGAAQASQVKSRAEILAELRDMKRRRTRYRVAANTSNYSDVLRDVIKTQMELYAEAKGIFIKTEYGPKNYVSLNKSVERENNSSNMSNIIIKQERISPDTASSLHRERNTSTDRRRTQTQRTNFHNFASVPKRRRDLERYANSSDRSQYKDLGQDKYSEKRGRYDNGHSKNATKHESQCNEHNKHRSCREDSSKNRKYDQRGKYDKNQRELKHSNKYREEKLPATNSGRHHFYAQIKEEKMDYSQIKEEKADYYENSKVKYKKQHRH